MKKTKILLLTAIILIFLSSIISLVFIPYFDGLINGIDSEIELLQQRINIRNYNLNQFSNEAIKGTANYGYYYILKELNSSKIVDFDGKYKNGLVNSIGILTEGNLSRSYLNTKSVPELDKIAKEKLNEYLNIQSDENNRLLKLKRSRENIESWRNFWLLVTGILQAIALVLGISAEYIEIKS